MIQWIQRIGISMVQSQVFSPAAYPLALIFVASFPKEDKFCSAHKRSVRYLGSSQETEKYLRGQR